MNRQPIDLIDFKDTYAVYRKTRNIIGDQIEGKVIAHCINVVSLRQRHIIMSAIVVAIKNEVSNGVFG